jgi:glutathione synthase
MNFAILAAEQGVLVVDDPRTLLWAEGKLYLQHFPEAVRPRTLITRSLPELRDFYEAMGKRVVLKPLEGYGGADVFLLGEDDTNLNTIVQSMARRGFIIAQEYLPAATAGDIRFFMLNGRPFEVEGRYAAINRVNPGDWRSNMTAGGSAEKAEVGETQLRVAELVGPRLKEDGIFLAGLDIVGDRLVEINVLSPGGLWSAGRLEGVDFGAAAVRSLERKLEHRAGAAGRISNRELASWDG